MHLLNKATPDNKPCTPGAAKGVLVVTAIPAEREAVLCGLHGNGRWEVVAAGVGPVAAAVKTAKLLSGSRYRLVISAGIGGGFSGRAELGSLVLADEIVAADLGVETPEGFCSLDELGYGPTRLTVDKNLARAATGALQAANLPVVTGPVLTVTTVTGTADSARELVSRVPGAAAEGMEGFAVAWAARDCGLPVLELRAISNLVGPRDRAAWRVDEALQLLAQAFAVLGGAL